jgi:small conductance mechanosensitive channel
LEKIIVGLESLLESILLALPRYVIGLLVLVVGIYVSGFIVKIIGRRFAKRDLDKSLQGFLLSAIRLMLYIVLFVVVIGIMGFKSLSLTAVFGAAGLTVGMALQGSLSNFAGGVLILMFRLDVLPPHHAGVHAARVEQPRVAASLRHRYVPFADGR